LVTSALKLCWHGPGRSPGSIRITLSPQSIGVPKGALVPVAMIVSSLLTTRGPVSGDGAARCPGTRGRFGPPMREPLRAPARKRTRTPLPPRNDACQPRHREPPGADRGEDHHTEPDPAIKSPASWDNRARNSHGCSHDARHPEHRPVDEPPRPRGILRKPGPVISRALGCGGVRR
jgi:hypothetical protein